MTTQVPTTAQMPIEYQGKGKYVLTFPDASALDTPQAAQALKDTLSHFVHAEKKPLEHRHLVVDFGNVATADGNHAFEPLIVANRLIKKRGDRMTVVNIPHDIDVLTRLFRIDELLTLAPHQTAEEFLSGKQTAVAAVSA